MATKRLPIAKIPHIRLQNTAEPVDKVLIDLDKTLMRMGKKPKVATAPKPNSEIHPPKAHWRPVRITADVEFKLSAKRPKEKTD